MLGPLFALTLLVTPAGPVDQTCWLLCSDSGTSRGPTVGERFQQQQWEQRVERLEQQERSRRFEETMYPPVTRPVGGYDSPTTSRGCTAALVQAAC